MTEQESIAAILAANCQATRDHAQLPPSVFDKVERALRNFPESAELWCLRGDMIQLASDECPCELSDALVCYMRAVEIDATCGEAYESIGYYYDTFTDDLDSAEVAFRQAVELGAGLDSHLGFARVLAQRGKHASALHVLDCCPAQNDEKVRAMRHDIESRVWT